MTACPHVDSSVSRHGYRDIVLLLGEKLIDENDDESEDDADQLRGKQEEGEDDRGGLIGNGRNVTRGNTHLVTATVGVPVVRHRKLQLREWGSTSCAFLHSLFFAFVGEVPGLCFFAWEKFVDHLLLIKAH